MVFCYSSPRKFILSCRTQQLLSLMVNLFDGISEDNWFLSHDLDKDTKHTCGEEISKGTACLWPLLYEGCEKRYEIIESLFYTFSYSREFNNLIKAKSLSIRFKS